ncbi:MAG: biotin/lipoyl-containing protein [Myxococcota bacterium]
MKYRVQIGDQEKELSVHRQPSGALEIYVDGEPFRGDVRVLPDAVSLIVDGTVHDIAVGQHGNGLLAAVKRVRTSVTVQNPARARQRTRHASEASGELLAPMPGRVVKVLVQEGDTVEAGQPVLIIEAMKMENELRAGGPGRVKKVAVTEGQSVEGNALLIAFE